LVQSRVSFLMKNVIFSLIFISTQTAPYTYQNLNTTGITMNYKIEKNGSFHSVLSYDIYNYTDLQYKYTQNNYVFMVSAAYIDFDG